MVAFLKKASPILLVAMGLHLGLSGAMAQQGGVAEGSTADKTGWAPEEVQNALRGKTQKKTYGYSMEDVSREMHRIYSMPYRHHEGWMSPEEYEKQGYGVCRDKALALYNFMNTRGANVTYVIGKGMADQEYDHAWVVWQRADGDYLLDPTWYSEPKRMDYSTLKTHLPYYGYQGEKFIRFKNFENLNPQMVKDFKKAGNLPEKMTSGSQKKKQAGTSGSQSGSSTQTGGSYNKPSVSGFSSDGGPRRSFFSR